MSRISADEDAPILETISHEAAPDPVFIRQLLIFEIRSHTQKHPNAGIAIDAGGGSIDLEFAAGATVSLRTAGIRCWLRDLGEPWPTRWYPAHEMDQPR